MATLNRSKSVKIADPSAFFANWAFSIEPHHYETLGLGYRKFMKEKQEYCSWAAMNPIEYWLNTGDVFYDAKNPRHFLQVVADWDALHIEVHEGLIGAEKGRSAFAVTEDVFSNWLRTGIRPPDLEQLDIPTSKAGLLAWKIANQPYDANRVSDDPIVNEHRSTDAPLNK